MTVELFHLCIYGLVIVGATLVQQLTSIFNVGLMPVFGSREGINFTGMTGRLERAILNCAIAMALIVPPIMALGIMEMSSANTVLAAQIFLWSRIAYIISYGIGIMGIRSAAWVSSLLCTLFLYYTVISVT
mgnify:FL=1|tara:strand:- start:745 stop:1137 length:393 start_codon:yes stop_codon:yes gene_type:complete